MKTVTLKADDTFYSILTDMTKSLHTTKSDIIRKSVLYYKDILEKEQLKAQIKQASQKVKEHSLKTAQELDDTLIDGLNNV